MQVIDFLVEDAYETLTSKKQGWPKQMSKLERLDFIEKVRAYWELKEDYNKCQVWHDLKLKV